MDMQPGPSHEGTDTSMSAADAPILLPVRFRRDPADLARADPLRGIFPAKQPREYYLNGLKAVFHPDVTLPDPLDVDPSLSGAEVVLLNPGPNVVEVMGILSRHPQISCLHIVETCEANLDSLRSGLAKEAHPLPELAGYVTDMSHLPDVLAGRCDLAIEINVIDPKADRLLRQDIARQISRLLKLGGLFYSAGETVRWTDGVIPLSLVPIPVETEHWKRAGYSDALPQPVFFQKHSPGAPMQFAEEVALREWWQRGLELIGQGDDAETVGVDAPFVPRVEDGRGEPNAAPWNFLITKPAVRRPAMDWTPEESDRFGNLTLGTLLQFNGQTGMYVFLVRECPDVVLKIMKPFEGDLPDDPLEWNSLRKSKTLKRENQALKLLKGLAFIPQHIAHGYDPVTGWYGIVVEYEKSRSLSHLMVLLHNRRHRQHETPADVEAALEPVLALLNSLAIVHDKGLVHQDLKPGHVLLRPDSREAVLIDWGLARGIDEPLSDDRRSISWLHAAPERADMNVKTAAAIHQDLYAVGVILIQLASDRDFSQQPRFLLDYFHKHGRTPDAAEVKSMLRPHWKWVAPVIARAISSRLDVPGYVDNRYGSARVMAEDIARRRSEKV